MDKIETSNGSCEVTTVDRGLGVEVQYTNASIDDPELKSFVETVVQEFESALHDPYALRCLRHMPASAVLDGWKGVEIQLHYVLGNIEDNDENQNLTEALSEYCQRARSNACQPEKGERPKLMSARER